MKLYFLQNNNSTLIKVQSVCQFDMRDQDGNSFNQHFITKTVFCKAKMVPTSPALRNYRDKTNVVKCPKHELIYRSMCEWHRSDLFGKLVKFNSQPGKELIVLISHVNCKEFATEKEKQNPPRAFFSFGSSHSFQVFWCYVSYGGPNIR